MNTASSEVNKTKASKISASLRNAIIFGDLKPGEKITESKISKKSFRNFKSISNKIQLRTIN